MTTTQRLFAYLLLGLVSGRASSQIHFVASLNGAQETPAVSTPATGSGSFTLSDDLTEVGYVITYQGLSGTLSAGAHLHVAGEGRPGPVIKTLALPGDPASGRITGSWKTTDATQPLTTALVESLITGRVYVNFHTVANSGGEIRGQLKLATAVLFTVDLDGSQANPPVITTAAGTGGVILKPGLSEIEYTFAYQGLSGPLTAGGHIHVGPPGQSGPIVKAVALSGDSASNLIQGEWKVTDSVQPLTAALIDSLVAGRLYANFHTAAHPPGEIRGQLTIAGGTAFGAILSGDDEVPTVATEGRGFGYFVLDAARSRLAYAVTYFKLSGPLTAGGHFHAAGSGKIGPVVKGIATSGMPPSTTLSGVWSSSDGSNPLTAANVDSLFTKRVYVNFHTSAHPGGEIRGQVELLSGYGFTVLMDGSQDVPPAITPALGSASVVLAPGIDSVQYDVTYFGLSGTLTAGGHFHVADAGRTGPVVKTIAASGGASSATYQGSWRPSDAVQPLTETLVDSLIAGKWYINFHTAALPGGEIRGQVLFPAATTTSVDQVSSAVPLDFTLHQNYPNPFNPLTNIAFDVPRAGRIQMKVYNVIGQEVATVIDESMEPGTYTVRFDAGSLASGIYMYALLTEQGVSTVRKMVLVR